ncbi:MAG: TIR domain-containing protein, partial [Chloroflexi bacterium CFX2]|nr:TIR domain-containing protein [Chloroflexi bacterium CFX2]
MNSFRSIELDVWVDWEDIPPAVGWLDQILQGIEQADAFIFLVSPDSVASEVCNVELEHAHKNAKRIIPIVVRDVDPKSTRDVIRNLNWIFMRENEDFAAGLEKVKVAINLDLDWLQEHRRLQVRALEWDRKKDPSLLLRGGDLRNTSRMIITKEGKDPAPSELQRQYVQFSRRSERVRTVTWISAALAILIMLVLSLFALNQRQVALANADEAQNQRAIAESNQKTAESNARAALIAKAAADKNAAIANAQRSAARAQIYQTRTGGLFTSTLLAIDSYQRIPSFEAEEILRENISLLPVPVKDIRHEGSILAIKVSPGGDTFVTASDDGTACLVRFESGESLFCSTSSGSVLDAAFGPDGKVLVTSASSGQVLVLDAESGEVLKELNYGVPVFSVNISPDGELLALARDDARISLVKMSSYEFAGEFSVFGSLSVTAFSPDGNLFAAGSDAGAVTFWDLKSREITGEQMLKVLAEDWVEDVEFSPDGSWFVTASNDFRIRVWDAETGEERLRLLQDSIVNDVKISPDGLWIASTGSDRTVRVWSAADGAEMFQIPLVGEGIVLEFSGDGSYLVAGDELGHVSLWDISTIKSNTRYVRFDEFIERVEMSPQGDWFSASTGGQVWLLDPENFPQPTDPPTDPLIDFFDDDVWEMVMDPAGKMLAVSTAEGHVVTIAIPSGRAGTLIDNGPSQSLAFSPDGSSLYLGSEEGLIQTRRMTTGEDGLLWNAEQPVYAIAVSSANLLAIGMEDVIVLFDPAAKSVIGELESPGLNHLLAFHPDGNLLVSSSLSGTISFWRMEGNEFKLQNSVTGHPAVSISFTPDGQRLFLGGTDRVLIFDPQSGTEVHRIRQNADTVDIAFSADGKTLYAASMRTLRFFDISSLTEIS